MINPRANLLDALRRTVAMVQALGLVEVKTEAHYSRVLDKNVRELYSGKLEQRQFVDDMVDMIDQQFTRAWNEGMRINGLNPSRDMTDEWAGILEEQKLRELLFIENYANDIIAAAQAGEDIAPLRGRVALWTNRYNEIVNLALVTTRPEDRFAWRLGATEKHCRTCFTLNGIVATAKEWQASGYHPQGAPNHKLECGGWQCDCSYEQTDEPATEGGIPII